MVCRVSKNDTRQRSLFAECQEKTLDKGLKQLLAVNGGVPLPSVLFCRMPSTRQTTSLSSVIVCRVLGTRQTTSLPSAFSLALGKQPLYRVSDKKHSAKSGTLGKEVVSGSELYHNERLEEASPNSTR